MKQLSDIVGREHVQTDSATREYYSNDIFFWENGRTATAVVAPGSADEVVALVGAANEQGFKLSLRGGGMSYSGGYVPVVDNCVLVDLRRLDQINEINPADRYLSVGAGASWLSVNEALAESGLRIEFRAPFSGSVSTVGGALSQSVPGNMGGIAGLQVVTGGGELVNTGSGARADDSNPFFRYYGPDLAGMFIGDDAGAFGIKTAAVLKLVDPPAAEAHASFAFETFEDLIDAMVGCSGVGALGRCVGLDPRKSQNAPKVGFKKAIETLGGILKESEGSRFKETLRIARSGRDFMKGVKWSLHLSTQGVNADVAEAEMDVIRQVCLKQSREIANLLPLALSVTPFSVRGFLGPKGERWVPTNAIVPPSRAREMATRVQTYFESQREAMQGHDIWESYIIGMHAGCIVIEPSFYWRDKVSQMQLDLLDKKSAREFAGAAEDKQAREFAQKLRRGLKQAMDEGGAAHVQIAKNYAYADRIKPGTRAVLQAVKDALDPNAVLNPGNLGLG